MFMKVSTEDIVDTIEVIDSYDKYGRLQIIFEKRASISCQYKKFSDLRVQSETILDFGQLTLFTSFLDAYLVFDDDRISLKLFESKKDKNPISLIAHLI